MYGIPPFYHQNQSTMYELIKEANLKFPSVPQISDEGKDFIKCVKYFKIYIFNLPAVGQRY